MYVCAGLCMYACSCVCACVCACECMWPWIWSAVAGLVFTRPREQCKCVIRVRQANRACPNHSWHQGLGVVLGTTTSPLINVGAWEDGGTVPCSALLLPRRCMKVRKVHHWPAHLTVQCIDASYDSVDNGRRFQNRTEAETFEAYISR